MYKLRTSCRACGWGTLAPGVKLTAEELIPVFDLGIQPLANDFAAEGGIHHGYAPLKVMCCPRCTLAQLSVTVDPTVLYSNYLYVTSPTQTMRDHFAALHKVIREEEPFTSLLEIGSNDGAFLRYLNSHNVAVAGIDPAANLAPSDVSSIVGVFNSQTAQQAAGYCPRGFDVVLARHVFCHVDDWRDFIHCLGFTIHKHSLVCIEVPYVGDLLKRREFDTIYHEHLSYLSIKSFQALLQDSAFRLQRIVPLTIHGGAILLMLRPTSWPDPPHPSVSAYRDREHISVDTWRNFSDRVEVDILKLKNFVADAREQGARIAGYGASAKSTVWLNACGFSRKEIGFVTDTTPQKQYRLCPGTDIPVVDEGAILRELPDYAIVFCWNFREEVLAKNQPAIAKGVKFVFPIPKLEVVSTLDKSTAQA